MIPGALRAVLADDRLLAEFSERVEVSTSTPLIRYVAYGDLPIR